MAVSAFGVDHGLVSKAQADWGDMNSSEKKKLAGGTGAALAAIVPTVAGPPVAMRGHQEAKTADRWARNYSDDAWSTIREGFRPDTKVRATRTDGVGGPKELPAGSRKPTSSKGPVGVNIPESAKNAFRNARREAKWARRARNIRNAGIAATVGGAAVYAGGLKTVQDAQNSANKRVNAKLKAKKSV